MEFHTIELLTSPHYCTLDLHAIEDHAFHVVSFPPLLAQGKGRNERGTRRETSNANVIVREEKSYVCAELPQVCRGERKCAEESHITLAITF